MGSVMHCNDINSLRAWGLPARLPGIGVVYHHHALNRMWWPPHLLSLGLRQRSALHFRQSR